MGLEDRFTTIGFIGAGNMASALLKAVAGRGLLPPSACLAIDAVPGKAEALAAELGIRAAASLAELAAGARDIVLATKPQDLMKVLAELAPMLTPEHRIVSIAAGVTCARIESALPPGTRVVRVMPNTPALVGAGAAGVAAGTHARPEDARAVVALFEAAGMAAEVPESALDAVTALSGSGPAYVFRFMEILSEAGAAMGLEPELARRLTLQTFLGAARLAAETGEDPAELRRKVTSPGGTTAAALEVFEARGLAEVLKAGALRAKERSAELAAKA